MLRLQFYDYDFAFCSFLGCAEPQVLSPHPWLSFGALGIIAHTMKKIITIGFVAALLVIVILLAWQHFKPSRDVIIQQKLTGTWVVDFGHGMSDRTIIHSDGSFESQTTGFVNGGVGSLGGTILVKDGEMVKTITKDSHTNSPVPYVIRRHIIRIDDNELVTKWSPAAPELVERKVKP